jgi:hypothetical protein
MVMRAAQDLEVQEAGNLMIVEEPAGRGDVAQHVLPLGAFADFLKVVVALVGEQVFAEFEHCRPQARRAPRDVAAARTALMIGS